MSDSAEHHNQFIPLASHLVAVLSTGSENLQQKDWSGWWRLLWCSLYHLCWQHQQRGVCSAVNLQPENSTVWETHCWTEAEKQTPMLSSSTQCPVEGSRTKRVSSQKPRRPPCNGLWHPLSLIPQHLFASIELFIIALLWCITAQTNVVIDEKKNNKMIQHYTGRDCVNGIFIVQIQHKKTWLLWF